ncbi:uncharacterized protein LOC106659267 [Trichogramma pretiosum]|uniref:uncharacterized protein LOC106659267 n=1 Tax=Trichogramma pretiosum TaxID=7493 RepID=UPI0006C9AE0C|nr:uncharacterized protein LOC106659267 [Trichogramma pretiosum]
MYRDRSPPLPWLLVHLLVFATACCCLAASTSSSLGDGIKSGAQQRYVPPEANEADENGECVKRVQYSEKVADDIDRGIVQLAPASQPLGPKQPGDWISIVDCCAGYARNDESLRCEPQCDEGCLGGNCTGPNVCVCELGWYPEAGVCKPICRQRCQLNSYCFAPDVCTCQFGYEDVGGVCRPACANGCENGICVAPRVCRCYPGYRLNETGVCDPVCEGGCGNGTCTAPGVCTCDEGYKNANYNLELCVPDCPGDCSNGGTCVSPGNCDCTTGYEHQDNGTCTPVCQNECENGFCAAPDLCECNPGYRMDYRSQKCIEDPYSSGGYQNIPNRNPTTAQPGARGTFQPSSSGANYPHQQHENPLRGQQHAEDYGGQRTETPINPVYGVTQNERNPTTVRPGPFGSFRPPTANYDRQNGENPSRGQSPHQQYGEQRPVYGNQQNERNPSTVRPGPYGTTRPSVNDNQRPIYGNQQNERNPSTVRPGLYGTSRPAADDNQRPVYQNERNPSTVRPSPYGTSRPSDYNQRPINGNAQTERYPGSQVPIGDRHGNHGTDDDQRINNPYEIFSSMDHPQEVLGLDGVSHRQTTPRPDDPYSRYNNDRRPNSPSNTQVPYSNQNRNPYDREDINRQPHTTRKPATAQGFFPAEDRNPYGSREPSQTLEPPRVTGLAEDTHFGQRLSPDTHGNDRTTIDPYGRYSYTQTQRPVGTSNSQNDPSRTQHQGPYKTSNPHAVNHQTSPQHRPETSQGHYINSEGSYLPPDRANSQGVKSPGTQIYGRPGVIQTQQGFPEVSILAFEMHEIAPGISEFSFPGGEGPGLSLSPYGMSNRFGAVCSHACINGLCVGPNECACLQGYVPDSRIPGGHVCAPVCHGGCANGVCSAPNLCICNPGYIQQSGLKATNRCVPLFTHIE